MHDANLCKLFDAWIIFMNEIVPKSMSVYLNVACFGILNLVFVHEEMYQFILFSMHVHCTMIIVNQGSRGNDIFIFLKNARISKGYGIKRILYIYLNNNFNI